MGSAIKKATKWQYVRYHCYDCKYKGECACRIGEHPFCGRCGSQDLVKPKGQVLRVVKRGKQ